MVVTYKLLLFSMQLCTHACGCSCYESKVKSSLQCYFYLHAKTRSLVTPESFTVNYDTLKFVSAKEF
jgi:hypothetical protein